MSRLLARLLVESGRLTPARVLANPIGLPYRDLDDVMAHSAAHFEHLGPSVDMASIPTIILPVSSRLYRRARV